MNEINEVKPQDVDAQTLKQLLDHQAVLLIDVREPAEYAEEHIASAKLLPLSRFRPTQVVQEFGQQVVLYCQSGNRSAQISQRLLTAGFLEISYLKGGLAAWKEAGYLTEIKPNAPISLMRQVQIVAGSLVCLGTGLGAFISVWFLLLSSFVGLGLVYAGVTNTCTMAMLLAKLPYNQQGRIL